MPTAARPQAVAVAALALPAVEPVAVAALALPAVEPVAVAALALPGRRTGSGAGGAGRRTGRAGCGAGLAGTPVRAAGRRPAQMRRHLPTIG